MVGIMAKLPMFKFLKELLCLILGPGHGDLLHKASREVTNSVLYLARPPTIRAFLYDLYQVDNKLKSHYSIEDYVTDDAYYSRG